MPECLKIPFISEPSVSFLQIQSAKKEGCNETGKVIMKRPSLFSLVSLSFSIVRKDKKKQPNEFNDFRLTSQGYLIYKARYSSQLLVSE
ncbi:hypothetical protein CEXT_741871 [Caerostris extrusa]|uniref:Uncharacterized protein n=1 Tax=Caerostris extrusa TaxID=172846 RepID=A0AAV4VEB9_CAEEX|nr:hypothetical protein CEXT_741871 [Caerostris extrusa]